MAPVSEMLPAALQHWAGVLALVLAPLILYQAYGWFNSGKKGPVFLDPSVFKELPLIDRKELSHNTRRFRFGLPSKAHILGLPIGQHITFKFKGDDGAEVFRPYTPVTDDDTPGHVDFVIKVYPQGKMSQRLDKLQLGEAMQFKGPKGRYTYQTGSLTDIGMLAGGTGVTPMYQVAKAILKYKSDRTRIRLIFANLTADDILIQDLLDELQATSQGQFQVYYVLNEAPPGWKGGVGFISQQMIKDFLPQPGPHVQVLRCGPMPMNKAMAGHLDSLGYTKEMQFEF